MVPKDKPVGINKKSVLKSSVIINMIPNLGLTKIKIFFCSKKSYAKYNINGI